MDDEFPNGSSVGRHELQIDVTDLISTHSTLQLNLSTFILSV